MTDKEKIEELRTHLMQNQSIRQPLARTTTQFEEFDRRIQNSREAREPSPYGDTRNSAKYNKEISDIETTKQKVGKEVSDYIRNKARQELSGPEYSHLPKDDASIQKALPELNRFDDRSDKSIDMDKKQDEFKAALDRSKTKDQSREQKPQPQKTKGHDRDDR